MNNSSLQPEATKDKAVMLRERDAHLVRLIEAITDVQKTSAWSTLKEDLDSEVARLNRLLLTESKKKELDLPEVYRLQGRIGKEVLSRHHAHGRIR